MAQSKSEKYLDLVRRFKEHVFSSDELLNPHAIDGFNFDVINPWELWHNNLNAEIMFIGQDFSDTASLKSNLNSDWEKEKKGKTNLQVAEFFCVLGPKYFFENVDYSVQKKKQPLFFTNAILGIKQSDFDNNKEEKQNMSKSVKDSWFKESSSFLKELIEIVSPRYIIVMGKTAYKAICHLYQIKPLGKMVDAIENPIELLDGKIVLTVQHCSGLGQVRRPLANQMNDWMKIRNIIDPG